MADEPPGKFWHSLRGPSGYFAAMPTDARKLLLAKTAGWRETVVLAVVAGLVPFLVHLIPWAGPRPLGVHLLPVFWTAFVAVYFHGALTGLAVGLVTPLVNLALTGLPAFGTVGPMAFEVACFALGAAWLGSRWPGFWFTAPLAWVAAKALAIAAQALLPAMPPAGPPLEHLLRSTQNGLAGLGVLAVINWLLVAFYPQAADGKRE